MHAMQEDDLSHDEAHSGSNGYLGAMDGQALYAPQKQGPSLRLTLAAVAGMLLPLVTQVGHHH